MLNTRLLLMIAVSGALAGTVLYGQPDKETELPRVLIIGDSISMGYTPTVADALRGKATVVHNPGNAADTAYTLARLDSWLGERWNVIHFNHGLHDFKLVDGNGKVSKTGHINNSIDEYKANMEAIVLRLKETGAKLIFATTTPYPRNVRCGLWPSECLSEKYNEPALEVMRKHDVEVNDLYSFVLPRMATLQMESDVHFTPAGSDALGREVAKHILGAIGQQKYSPPPNMIGNPSVEELADGKPLGWGWYQNCGEVEFGVSPHAHTGNTCVYLKNIAFAVNGGLNNAIVCGSSDGESGDQACSAKPNTTYCFSCYVKGDVKKIYVNAFGWTSAGERRQLKISTGRVITPTSEWKKYQGTFMTSDTEAFCISFGSSGSENAVAPGSGFYLDDLYICELKDLNSMTDTERAVSQACTTNRRER